MVIPKVLRDRLGLAPGEVELTADGAALRVESIAGDGLVERDGRLTIPASGVTLSDDDVRAMRDADQRDALVAATASEHDLVLATRDRRAIPTYRALDAQIEVIPA